MASATSTILDAATAVQPEVVALRRRLHRRPEIGLDLPETQAVVAEALRALGLEPQLGGTTTSVTAVIEGAHPGPTILLRADMDALPLQEETGLDFASEIPGVMHACGHDTHVAMLLGAARLLVERRDQLAGNVLLMFQPGEEGHFGARFMLDEGLLSARGAPAAAPGAVEATDVARAFAIHIGTRYAAGTFALRPGALLASSDKLVATIRGRGGHASSPHLALDPITTVAQLILALYAMVTRRIDVFDPAVVTITRVTAGTTNNIIPEVAEIEGTIRTVSESTRKLVLEQVRQVAAGIAAAHGASIDLEIVPGYPVTSNDPEIAAWARDVAVALVGEDAVEDLAAPIMGAEDFSYVLQRVPGVFVFLGARPVDQDPATAPQNHSNKVVFDEPSMALGVALYAAAALDFLAPSGGR